MTISELSARLADASQPLNLHLIGVAGSGMSGIARLLLGMGHEVTGSDRINSGETESLQKKGLKFFTPQTAEAVKGAEVVIFSSAIRPNNPARAAAKEAGVPMFRRAECLAAIMALKEGIVISGTHGKTTTSAMTAHILRQETQPPCHYVGAEIPVLGQNAHWNPLGRHLIAEGDESDGTLVLYRPTHTVVLNMEEEHLDHYEDGMAGIRKVFTQLAEQTSGPLVYCGECPETRKLGQSRPGSVSYGWSEADWVAEDVRELPGTVSFDVKYRGEAKGRVELGIPGRHNVLNALGAMAVADLCGADFFRMAQALESFAGAKRRFETKYVSDRYRVVDDYGHHPTEIRATLETAKAYEPKRIVVLFQPHRFSRTQKLAAEFGEALGLADVVLVTDVYAASEDPIPGISGQTIADAVNSDGSKKAEFVGPVRTAHYRLGNVLEEGDFVITLGAGDVHEAGSAVARDLRIVEDLLALNEAPKVKLYEPMDRHCTLRVGGPAQFWVEPDTLNGFSRTVRYFKERSLPVRVIGRGSNLLVRDGGLRGAVIHPKGGIFSECKVGGDTIKAGAGVRFKKLASLAREHRIGGFEWMEGIPGNVGGGLRMNAGAMGVETFDQVVEVVFYDEDGQIRKRDRKEIKAYYRNAPEFARNFGLVATFKGVPAPQEKIQALLDESRHHRNTTQPKAASAGCSFKNPEGILIGAGQLIDELGLKGLSVGAAQVSDEHGNFIVNRGGATADDVLGLLGKIQNIAREKKGVELKTEVQIVGEAEQVF